MERDVLNGSVVLWGQGSDGPVSVAAFIAAQRTEHQVPHAIACRALGVSQSWFYKWRNRPPTPRQDRCNRLAAAVRNVFDDSVGTYGKPAHRHRVARTGLAGLQHHNRAADRAGAGCRLVRLHDRDRHGEASSTSPPSSTCTLVASSATPWASTTTPPSGRTSPASPPSCRRADRSSPCKAEQEHLSDRQRQPARGRPSGLRRGRRPGRTANSRAW